MNTSGRVMQGLPNPDGHIIIEPTEFSFASGGAAARAGLGLLNFVVPASATTTLDYDLAGLIFRYGSQDDSQMQFGQINSQSGAQGLALLPGVNFQTPYSTASRPPIPSAQVFGSGTGTASVIPKGITIKAVNLTYQVLGANLTSATVGITKTQYAVAATAPVVSNILTAANNGILLPVAANPITVNVPILAANQIMLTSRLAKYILELSFVAPAGCTVNLSGIFLDVAYNYN